MNSPAQRCQWLAITHSVTRGESICPVRSSQRVPDPIGGRSGTPFVAPRLGRSPLTFAGDTQLLGGGNFTSAQMTSVP